LKRPTNRLPRAYRNLTPDPAGRVPCGITNGTVSYPFDRQLRRIEIEQNCLLDAWIAIQLLQI
jgi:hypothetical protein